MARAPVWGPHGDAVAEFLLALLGFTAVVLDGVCPAWPLAIILVMLGQFVATFGLQRPVHDPMGTQCGAFLYAALAATLLSPDPVVAHGTPLGKVAATIATVGSQTVFLFRHRQHAPQAS